MDPIGAILVLAANAGSAVAFLLLILDPAIAPVSRWLAESVVLASSAI